MQAQALTEAAGALAVAGRHEQAAAMASQAATVARSIANPYEQARALAEVAGALAKAGQHEQAATVARSINDLDRQSRALAGVAKALMARGYTRQARHMASAACAVGQRTTVLELVLTLEPSALRVLIDL